jgi:Fe2+ transport system protein FeoA
MASLTLAEAEQILAAAKAKVMAMGVKMGSDIQVMLTGRCHCATH